VSPIGQDLKSTDVFTQTTSKEPVIEQALAQHAETQADIDQGSKLLQEAIKIRKPLS